MDRSFFISIVIPTYNRQLRVKQAIESVLAQTYRDFEIIVIDDGSTDATEVTIRTLMRQQTSSPSIRYLRQTNAGPSAARNTGVEEATGDWIAFLDSDDIWMPGKLQQQVQAIRQFGDRCGACFTDARLTDSLGLDTTAFRQACWSYADAEGIAEDLVRRLALAWGGVWVQTVVARTELAKRAGAFDPKVQFGEDYDFLFRLALLTDYCYVNEPLAIIDRSTAVFDPKVAARQWDRVEFRLAARQLMYEKWLRLKNQYPEDVRRIVIRNLRGVHSGWANWYLETSQFEKAHRSAMQGLRYQVTPQLAVKWALALLAPRIAKRIAPKTAGIF